MRKSWFFGDQRPSTGKEVSRKRQMHSWEQQLQHPAPFALLTLGLGDHGSQSAKWCRSHGRQNGAPSDSAGEGHGAGKSRMKINAASCSRSMRLCAKESEIRLMQTHALLKSVLKVMSGCKRSVFCEWKLQPVSNRNHLV